MASLHKDKDLWQKFVWVKRGKQRRLVIQELENEQPVTGEELRKKMNTIIKTEPKFSLREISRNLRGFQQKGIVECLDDDAPYGRHYILTKKGSVIKEKIKKYAQKD